jgi:hypothetical protein
MRHPLDPPAAHAAAGFLGHLAAAGLADAAEARAALAAARGVDRRGLAARLARAFADAEAEWARRRGLAAARIRAQLTPLLAAGAGRAAILRAAAAEADGSLFPGEAPALAAALVAAQLRSGGAEWTRTRAGAPRSGTNGSAGARAWPTRRWSPPPPRCPSRGKFRRGNGYTAPG